MAAAHVAGAWALMTQQKPLASVWEVYVALWTTCVGVYDARPIAAGDTTGNAAKPLINLNRAPGALQVHYMTLNPPPTPGRGQWNLSQPLLAGGWAIDMSAPLGTGAGVTSVDVYADPFPEGSGPPVYSGPRGTACRGRMSAQYLAPSLRTRVGTSSCGAFRSTARTPCERWRTTLTAPPRPCWARAMRTWLRLRSCHSMFRAAVP